MHMVVRAGAAVALLTLIAGPLSVHAAPDAPLTGKQLLTFCEAKDPAGRNACRYFITGAVQAFALAAQADNNRHTFCFPGNLEPEGLVTLYTTTVKPDFAKIPADEGKPAIAWVATAMVSHFPCPK
jgi:Rap1a immunity proteins